MYTNVYRCLKWIIEKFMEKKSLTLEGLNELWVKEEDLSDGLEMRRKTFYNHRKAIKENFGIDICLRDEGYAYYIRNPEIIRNNSLMNFMLSTLAMNEKLIDCKALMNRIVLESIPSALPHGSPLRRKPPSPQLYQVYIVKVYCNSFMLTI